MKNRERYILKVNEYDLMMTINDNIKKRPFPCPIYAVSGKLDRCCADFTYICKDCVQHWLNEEENIYGQRS